MAPAPANDTGGSSGSLSSHATLSASYTNCSTTTKQISHIISAPIPSISSGTIKDKTAYLSELRTSTKQLQEEINTFLTNRMEEDMLQAVQKTAGKKSRDEIEEENYGKEEMEDGDEV